MIKDKKNTTFDLKNKKIQPASKDNLEKILTTKVLNAIWVSVSEAAKLTGVQSKTIRRALKNRTALKYKIKNNRYSIDLASLIIFMHNSSKLKNKLYQRGIGQYIQNWKK